MAKYRNLDRGDVLPASWTDALQEFIGTLAANVRLTMPNATTVRIAAAVNSGQAAIGIDGLWRYSTTTVDATASGAAGVKDIFVVAAANSFTGQDVDETEYTPGLQILAQGTTPTGNYMFPSGSKAIAAFRKVGELQWNGTAITELRQTVGVEDATAPITATAPNAGVTPGRFIGATGQTAPLIEGRIGLAGSNVFAVSAAGAITASGGLTLGGALTVTGNVAASGYLHGASGGGAGEAVRIGNDGSLHDVDTANTINLRGLSTATQGFLSFGSGGDVRIGRGATAAQMEVTGHLSLNSGSQYRINGAQITSADLSNNSALLKTTGDFSFSGTLTGTRTDAANFVGAASTSLPTFGIAGMTATGLGGAAAQGNNLSLMVNANPLLRLDSGRNDYSWRAASVIAASSAQFYWAYDFAEPTITGSTTGDEGLVRFGTTQTRLEALRKRGTASSDRWMLGFRADFPGSSGVQGTDFAHIIAASTPSGTGTGTHSIFTISTGSGTLTTRLALVLADGTTQRDGLLRLGGGTGGNHGSAAAPSYSFVDPGATGTGMYLVAGVLAWAVGGTQRATLDNSGNLNVTGQYRVGGSQISSANLSNDSSLAKLNGTQTFTGVNTFQNTASHFRSGATGTNLGVTVGRTAAEGTIGVAAAGGAYSTSALVGDVVIRHDTTASGLHLLTGTGAAAVSIVNNQVTLRGTPVAPTAAVDTNTTQLATTAFVIGQGYAKLAAQQTFSGATTFTGQTSLNRPAAGDSALHISVVGDAQARLLVAAGGTLTWGSGSAVGDTTLLRRSAGILETAGGLYATGASARLDARDATTGPTKISSIQPGYLYLSQALVTDKLIEGLVAAEVNARFQVLADGKVSWGPGGATAVDTNLYRSAADTLKTDDAFQAASYAVGTTPLAATHLSNGTTGTGAIALAVSPALTGTPSAPTAAGGTNTTQIATTAFVQAAVAVAAPAGAAYLANTQTFTGTNTFASGDLIVDRGAGTGAAVLMLTGRNTGSAQGPTTLTQQDTGDFTLAATQALNVNVSLQGTTRLRAHSSGATVFQTGTGAGTGLTVENTSNTQSGVLRIVGKTSGGVAQEVSLASGANGDFTLNSVSGSNQYFQFNGTSRLTVHTSGITVNGGVTASASGSFATGLTVDPGSGTTAATLTLTGRNAGATRTSTLTSGTDGSARLAVAAGAAIFLRVDSIDRLNIDGSGIAVAGTVFSTGTNTISNATSARLDLNKTGTGAGTSSIYDDGSLNLVPGTGRSTFLSLGGDGPVNILGNDATGRKLTLGGASSTIGFFNATGATRYASPTQAAIGTVPAALTTSSTLNDVIGWVSRIANALQGYGLLNTGGVWAA